MVQLFAHIMIQILPRKLIDLARACPFRLYAVGGAVRDFIAGLVPATRDWDICAPCTVEDMASAARASGWDIAARFPSTGSLVIKCGDVECQFTSFRTDSYGQSGHAPESVCFTDDIAVDARRRDFTCNAVYYDICGEQFVDPLGGIADIRAKKLVPCAPPKKLFAEDGVRILRLARFCGELGFSPQAEVLCGAAEAAYKFHGISPATIWREMKGIFAADEKYSQSGGCARALEVLNQTGVLTKVFPPLTALGKDCVERAICAVGRCPARIRAAALLYPLGAESAAECLGRYPAGKAFVHRISRVISGSEYDGSAAEMRSFFCRNGDIVGDCVLLLRAFGDERAEEWERLLEKMREEGVPFSLSQLKVRGGDILAAGVPQNHISGALGYLLERCAHDGSLNNKNSLIKLALEYSRTN